MSVATEHTPGPWAAYKYVGQSDNWFVRGSDDEPICGRGAGMVSGANARLIAAAPELLEALKRFTERGFFHAIDLTVEDFVFANAAIAKAEQSA